MEMYMRTLPFPRKHVMIFTWACFAFEVGHPPAGGQDAAFYIGVWTQLNFHDFLFESHIFGFPFHLHYT